MAPLRGIEDMKRLDELTGVENLSPVFMVADKEGAVPARQATKGASPAPTAVAPLVHHTPPPRSQASQPYFIAFALL